MEFDWFPLWLSLRVAFLSTLLAAGAGIAIAYCLANREFQGKEALDAAITLPLVLPPTVLGYYLLVLLGHESALGRVYEFIFGQQLVFTVQAAVLQVDCAGSALNLQAANRIVMLEPAWSPGVNAQAVARATRIGQENPVLVSWPVIRNSIDERVVVVTADDPLLVNALQRRADVVLQKSTREGFGLTVTEAMWKGAAVIGGNVGGIRRQIRDGENGFLVSTVDQASKRIVQVLRDPALRQRLGARAKETVRENFLMSRLLEDWLDLLAVHWRQARR